MNVVPIICHISVLKHRFNSCRYRKYPQFEQTEIFTLQDAFRKLDLDEKGYLDETTVIKATQQSERQPYDVVRQALKEVELDSSRRVELEDYVDVCTLLSGTPREHSTKVFALAHLQTPFGPNTDQALWHFRSCSYSRRTRKWDRLIPTCFQG